MQGLFSTNYFARYPTAGILEKAASKITRQPCENRLHISVLRAEYAESWFLRNMQTAVDHLFGDYALSASVTSLGKENRHEHQPRRIRFMRISMARNYHRRFARWRFRYNRTYGLFTEPRVLGGYRPREEVPSGQSHLIWLYSCIEPSEVKRAVKSLAYSASSWRFTRGTCWRGCNSFKV